MATVSELVVLVTANTSQFQSGMAKAEASTSKFATVAKIGFALAAVAAVKFVADSVEAYNEHQKALLELQTTIDNSPALVGASTAAFEEQATALQNLTGFQDEEILKADAVLGRFGLTADQLQEVNPLILDYARATGQDAATAAGSLGKALLGNTRALKTIGIAFTATGKTGQDFHTILDALESKVGGLSEAYGKTLPGQLAIAAAKFDDVKETVGKAVIPILTKLLDLVKPLIGVLQLAADHLDVVVVAGLAFAGWKFIPGLLDSIAAGLANLGFTGAGVALLETSAAIGSVGTAAVTAIPVIGMLGTEALTAAAGTQTAAEKTTELQKAFDAGSISAGQAAAMMRGVVPPAKAVAESVGDVGSQSKAAADKQAALNEELDKTTESMRDQLDAALSLADSTFGLISAARDNQTAEHELAAAHRTVARLEEEGKTGTKAYAEARQNLRDAAFDAAKSELDLAEAARKLQQDIASGKTSREEAVATIRDLGNAAHLSGKDIQGLVDDVKSGLNAAAKTAQQLAPGIGSSISHGIALGITTSSELISTAAAAAVHKAMEAARTAAGAHSPSQVMRVLGEDMIRGLVEGLEKNAQKAVDAATKVLQKVMDAASSFRGAISGGIAGFGDISGAFGSAEAPPTPESISAFAGSQVAGAQQLADVLNALQRQGASKGLLSQIAGGGAEAIPFAQALLQGGPQLIKEVNRSLASIADAAGDVSERITKTFFGERINELKAEVRDTKRELHLDLQALKLLDKKDEIHITINGDVTGEEVVRKVRDGLLKLGNRNAGTGL
jgi:hypothetical protein